MGTWIIKLPLLLILLVLVFLLIGCIRQDMKAKRPFFLKITNKDNSSSTEK